MTPGISAWRYCLFLTAFLLVEALVLYFVYA